MTEEQKPSVAHILCVFLAMSAEEQLPYFRYDLPENGEVFKNPLSVLHQALDILLGFFFDEFDSTYKDDEILLGEQRKFLSEIASKNLFSKSDFLAADEWQSFRNYAKKILNATDAPDCEIPKPLPFEEWLEFGDLSREAYDMYVRHMMKGVKGGEDKILPYE